MSAIVADASGKVGGNVFSNNRGGSYVRSWKKPTNPNTPKQAAQRGIFGTVATQWRELTEGQRQTFLANADNYPYVNRLGETKVLTGAQLYQKLNSVLLNAGLPFLTSCPPAPIQLTKMNLATAQKDIQVQVDGVVATFDIDFDLSEAVIKPTDVIAVYRSSQGSVGRQSTRIRQNLIGNFPASAFEVSGGIAKLNLSGDPNATAGLGPSVYKADARVTVSADIFNDKEGYKIPLGASTIIIKTIDTP